MASKWTEDEISFLFNNYEEMGAKYCSEYIDRKIYAIRRKANKLGISKKRKNEIYEENFLKKVISESKTYKEGLEKMGLRAAGGNYGILKKYIKKYNLNTDHFETHMDRFEKMINSNKKSLKDILINGSDYNRNHLKNRLYKEGLKEKVCEKCGQDEMWNGEKISLILDHINGIHNDNRIENLRILCPNCNATLDTHCGKNKKKYYCS